MSRNVKKTEMEIEEKERAREKKPQKRKQKKERELFLRLFGGLEPGLAGSWTQCKTQQGGNE